MDGLLLIDKPSGCTSHDVVARVRKLLGTSSVGHAGTLDPIASGLMVLLVGGATKLSDFILNGEKGYQVTLRMGVETDTLDREGQVVRESAPESDLEKIREVILSLQGEIDLPIPLFSAAKVRGKKLYEYAREGEEVVAPLKRMNFTAVEIVSLGSPEVVVNVRCSKGGFIRSFASEVGKRLGCGAIVQELRRLSSSPYSIDRAVTIEQLAEARPTMNQAVLGDGWIPLSHTLPDWRFCSIKGREERLLRNGQISHDLANRLIVEQKAAVREQKTVGIKVLNGAGELLGLLEAVPSQGLKIRRIFS